MEAIQTTRLTKYYGKARGIEAVDLTVHPGEFFGFIGPNGAGKSTTIRTLLGLIFPTAGRAQIFGLDVVKDRESVLRQIGYLPSETAFYRGLKVKELLKLSADLRGQHCAAERGLLCERLRLDGNRKVDELSFGNRKKAAIVCALQHRPPLLILDEPTGGLDPLMQKEFFDILRTRNREGTTIFLSSHILSEIQQNCARAAIIRDGRIIACDRVEALFKASAKRVSIRGKVCLDRLDGVRDRRDVGNSTHFLFSGELRDLIAALSAGQVDDLTIAEPDLEEIFLHYYEKGGDTP